METEPTNILDPTGGEKWVFLIVNGFCAAQPGTIEWTTLEMEILSHLKQGWSEDDLSSFRFRAFPVPEDWQSESDEYIIRTLVRANLPPELVEDRDWTCGRVTIAPELGLEYPFILVRKGLRAPVRLRFRR